MLRSKTALACVEVFRVGGRPGSAERIRRAGYFAFEVCLAKTGEESELALNVAFSREGAADPEVVTQVAARFGLLVTQKVAAQALPVVGGPRAALR